MMKRSSLRIAPRTLSTFTDGLAGILKPEVNQDMMKPSILGYGDHAFQINNVLVRQSVIVLPGHFLLWNARTVDDITIKNLSIFTLIYPTIEILFVGTGETYEKPLSPEVLSYFRSKGIVVEASGTMNAASTFNMLSGEGRNVACALLTLYPRPLHDDDEAEA